MRDARREQFERDPYRPLVQSDSWNRVILIWFIAAPFVVALLVLEFVPDWNWKELTAMMMFASASASVVQILGWVYELIKYRDRSISNRPTAEISALYEASAPNTIVDGLLSCGFQRLRRESGFQEGIHDD